MMITNWLNHLKLFFYPQVCALCGDLLNHTESGLCIPCEVSLQAFPYSFFDGNPVAQVFLYSVPINGANAYLNFIEGGRVQKLLHQIKYKGNKQLALFLGTKAGENALQQNPEYRPDVIIPVPLHFSKLAKRGYNQSELLAIGINKVYEAALDQSSVIRAVSTLTQTKKTRYSRFENMDGVFKVMTPENLLGKHIMVVDDMVTTGATVSSLCHEILKHGPASIVVYSFAFKA